VVNKKLDEKLKKLPTTAGVYFHKNSAGEIIYIGKAANLKNRVRQYFQKSRSRDTKTNALVAEIAMTDWMEVDSEIEALFLEAEQVRRYLPKYNILLRDDKSLTYIKITYDDKHPTVTTTRHPMDDKAKYFGPYLSSYNIKQALRILRKVFPYSTGKSISGNRASLHYHIGLDPGLEEGKTSIVEYRKNLRKLMAVIEGRREIIIKELEKDIKLLAKELKFEEAAKLRNQMYALKSLTKQIIFSDKEFQDLSKDHAMGELVTLLTLKKFPERIEGYDVSHMGGTDVVASMVTFTNGVSNRQEYRKFKTRQDKNDDFGNMKETLQRRLTEKNIKAWGKPDLILIDGGKGQLSAALEARNASEYGDIPFIGLAKREEQVVIHKEYSKVVLAEESLTNLNGYVEESDEFILVNLPHATNLVKLLQRIRDESHRFAISYHSTLKRKRQTSSVLDDIPGVGAVTRKKLIKAFGSLRTVGDATEEDISKVVGPSLAKKVAGHLTQTKK
jgi:excinuclease ABC subunit C